MGIRLAAKVTSMGEMDRNPGGDPAQLRVSDADREKVAEVLRRAAGEGRLDYEELDERLSATFAAKTYADLIPITVDLPDHPGRATAARPGPPPSPRPASAPSTVTHDSSVAVMGDCKRKGAWRVPENHTAFALMGSVLLDLRQASFCATTTEITANAIMGDVKVYVDAHTHVVLSGTPILGDFKQSRDKVPAQLSESSPTVVVKGIALMGSVSVVRLPPPGTPRKILGTY